MKTETMDTYVICIDYVDHRLKQKNIQWESCPELFQYPLDICEKMRKKGHMVKVDHLAKLIIDHTFGYYDFETVVLESIIDKTKMDWPQIIILLEWTANIAADCYNAGNHLLISSIVNWLCLFVECHILPWIESNGGWKFFK